MVTKASDIKVKFFLKLFSRNTGGSHQMQFNFDTIHNRRNTGSLKWDCTEKIFKDRDILPMWIADMDFLAPHNIVEAIGRRNEHGIFGYTESMPEAYCNAIISWVYKRHKWLIKREWLNYTPGVVPALSAAIMTYTEIGDKVVIQSPVYPPFYRIIQDNGRELVNNPLKLKNGHYEVDYNDLEIKFKSGVKMMILCSPHNPVGRVWTQEELIQLGELCLKNKVLLVSDEIHSDIVFSNHKHTPVASISKELAENSITCIAASKTFGIAGLATSTVIIPNMGLRAQYTNKIQSMGIEMGNIFGIIASEAAYKYGEEWLEHLLIYIQENLEFLMDYFDRNIPEINVIKPDGTYLVWLDCRNLGLNSKDLLEFMIHKAKIGLNDGTTFGIGGEGFLRINIACPRGILIEGLKRIERAILGKSA